MLEDDVIGCWRRGWILCHHEGSAQNITCFELLIHPWHFLEPQVLGTVWTPREPLSAFAGCHQHSGKCQTECVSPGLGGRGGYAGVCCAV